jgi:aspartate-semialdehyde dehydrogenase
MGLIVGIIGAGSLLGGEIFSQCEKAKIHGVRCFDNEPVEDEDFETSYQVNTLTVEPLKIDALEDCSVVIIATAECPAEIITWCHKTSKVIIIDCVNVCESFPLALPYLKQIEVNRKVRIPSTNAAHLALLLNCLNKIEEENSVHQVFITTLEPVSSAGQAALNELWQQGIAIYNQKTVEVKVLSDQVAFNCIPFGSNGSHTESEKLERRLQDELAKLTGIGELSIIVQMVRVPVYYGCSHSLVVSFAKPIAQEKIVEFLKKEVLIHCEEGTDFLPNPLNSSDSVNIEVSKLRAHGENSASFSNAFSMWVVSDNIRQRAHSALDLLQSMTRQVV